MVSQLNTQHFMELEAECDKTCNIFTSLLGDLKNGVPLFEDIISKSQKLHSAFKVLLVSSSAFLETFQKIADLACSTNGSTKEIGACLTRICLRQKSMEGKMKAFSGHLQDSLSTPLADKLEEWKKGCLQMEKERGKHLKKMRQDAKKAGTESIRLTKKRTSMRRGSGVEEQLDRALAEAERRQGSLLGAEQRWVRHVKAETRSRLCFFLSCLKPALDVLCGLTDELGLFRDLVDTLCQEATPEPPPSPLLGGSGSRSSVPSPAVSLNSLGSSDSYTRQPPGPGGVLLPGMPAHTLRPGSHGASNDSGFISQELPAPDREQRAEALLSQSGSEGSQTGESDEEEPQLYPDQSLPAPVYSNLSTLRHQAKRKFSISGPSAKGEEGAGLRRGSTGVESTTATMAINLLPPVAKQLTNTANSADYLRQTSCPTPTLSQLHQLSLSNMHTSTSLQHHPQSSPSNLQNCQSNSPKLQHYQTGSHYQASSTNQQQHYQASSTNQQQHYQASSTNQQQHYQASSTNQQQHYQASSINQQQIYQTSSVGAGTQHYQSPSQHYAHSQSASSLQQQLTASLQKRNQSAASLQAQQTSSAAAQQTQKVPGHHQQHYFNPEELPPPPPGF